MQRFSNIISRLTLLLICVTAVACTQEQPTDTNQITELENGLKATQTKLELAEVALAHQTARATERNPAKQYTNTMALGAKPVPEATLNDLLDVVKKGGPACPADVNTFVRNERGKDCDTYQAEIAGWADKCVGACDDASRLAEAVADAQLTCAAWCQTKKCPGPQFAAPQVCATSSCNNSKDCAAACPLKNSCFLLQANGVWNCQCVEI